MALVYQNEYEQFNANFTDYTVVLTTLYWQCTHGTTVSCDEPSQ